MSIRIGTASWTDKSLIDSGLFYPPRATTPTARLQHYASQFPLVEVDTSYYSIPTAQSARQWAERSPPGFTINVKAFRLFTGHQTSPAVLPADIREALPMALKLKAVVYYRELPAELIDALWQRFAAALAPLRDAGKLALVHFQFPPWLVRNRAGHAHVAHCVERMAGFKLAAEFRNISWLGDERHAADTLAFQRSLGLVHTIVDEPQGFTNSVPAVWATTDEGHALVRLHGRNAGTWNTRAGASSQRFNYDYDEAELEGMAHRILQLDASAPDLDVHVVFNNNMEDQGQRNGRTLMDLIAALGGALVPPSVATHEDELFELVA